LNFIKDCQNTAQSSSIDAYAAVYRIQSLIIWLKHKSITVEQAIDSNEAKWAFKILANAKSPFGLYQVAIDMMEIVIKSANASCEERIFKGIINLKLTINDVMKESRDKVELLLKLFTHLAEKFLPKMLITSETSHYSMEVLPTIIHFAQFHDFAELTFPFWHKVVESFQKKRTKNFDSFLEDLTCKLIANCQYKNIQHASMTLDSEDAFEKFRLTTFELIRSISAFVDSQKLFENLIKALETRVQSMEEFETILFAIECIAEHVDTTDDVNVPKIINYFISDSSESFFAIKYRSVKILGQLAHYLCANKHFIRSVVLHLKSCIVNDKGALACVAAHSIEQIASCCKRQMAENLNDFYEILNSLETFKMTQQGEESVLRTVTEIVNYLPEFEKFQAVMELCKLQCDKITADPVVYLRRVEIIFQHVESRAVASAVMREMWNYMQSLVSHYQNNEAVFAAVLSAIQRMIENVRGAAAPYLNMLFLQLFSMFTADKSVCIIKLFKKIVEALGGDKSCTSVLLTLFEALSLLTFNTLRDELNFDTLDRFFELSATFVNFMPLALLTSPIVLNIIDLSLKVCHLKDIDVNKSTLMFMRNMLACDKSNERLMLIVMQFVTLYGKSLIKTLLEASAFIFDVSLLSQVADIFILLRSESLQAFIYFLDSTLYQFSKFNSYGKKLPENVTIDFFNTMTQ
jgi:hypothetical protein